VRLTPAGSRRRAVLHEAYLNAVVCEVGGRLAPQDLLQLTALLDRLDPDLP
jgi:hypothetical protein